MMNKVSSVVVNGNVHYIYCNGYEYSIDLGVLGENLTEPAYFASQQDAVWYFKRLLKWPISDPYRLVLETNDLGDLRQRLNRAREMWLEYELYSVDDGHDNLAEDMDIELGFYKAGTPLVDIEDDFENATGITTDYMLGGENPFFDLERDFYTVRDDGTIELRGWMEERDTNWDGFYDDDMPRYTLITGDWPDVYDPKYDMTDWACPYQQYNEDMHYEEAVRFVRGYGGTYLPMYDIDLDTPAGDYWCHPHGEPSIALPFECWRFKLERTFELIDAETARSEYGWGVDLKKGSVVFRRVIGDTVIWVGKTWDQKASWICEVQVAGELEGQWTDDTPRKALFSGLVDAVSGIAVREMWDEPKERGLKYCCEDVVLAMATYGAQTMIYGFERLGELFPHSQEGVFVGSDHTDLYKCLTGTAIEYCKLNEKRLGIEFEDVWS